MNDEYNAAYGSANEIQNIAKSLDIPLVFFEVDQLHEYAFYPDMFYGVETYDAFFDFANYYLKNAPVKVFYTDPSVNEGDVSLTNKITVQFSGAVTLSEVSKITFTAEGTTLEGSWESVYGGTQWIFSPENLKGGTTYTITVPATLSGDNGVAMGTEYVSEFTTEYATDSILNAANGKYYTASYDFAPSETAFLKLADITEQMALVIDREHIIEVADGLISDLDLSKGQLLTSAEGNYIFIPFTCTYKGVESYGAYAAGYSSDGYFYEYTYACQNDTPDGEAEQFMQMLQSASFE
jgi:hypothetical protein